MKKKKIFIICTVRKASESYRKNLEDYVSELEKEGHHVHLPHRDTNQKADVFEICTENMNAIEVSDEVHIFYNPESLGTHFDMGVAFAFGKPVKIVQMEEQEKTKPFPSMLKEWEEADKNDSFILLEDTPPEKGKNLIAITKTGDTSYCTRCNCNDLNCLNGNAK